MVMFKMLLGSNRALDPLPTLQTSFAGLKWADHSPWHHSDGRRICYRFKKIIFSLFGRLSEVS